MSNLPASVRRAVLGWIYNEPESDTTRRVAAWVSAAVFAVVMLGFAVLFAAYGEWVPAVVVALLGVVLGLGMVWVLARKQSGKLE